MAVPTTNQYWIRPDALTITLNTPDVDYLRVSLLANSVIIAYVQDVIGYDPSHNYRKWTLQAVDTYLETSNAYYVHAQLTRSESPATALIVYSLTKRSITGKIVDSDGNETGEEDEEHYYVYLGKISASIDSSGNKVGRTWIEEYNPGKLDTNQGRMEGEAGFYLSKLFDDIAKGKISFQKGISLPVNPAPYKYEDVPNSDILWVADSAICAKGTDDYSLGQVVSAEDFIASNYVELEGAVKVNIGLYHPVNADNVFGLVFYTEDGTPVKGVYLSGNTEDGYTPTEIDVPASASRIRLTLGLTSEGYYLQLVYKTESSGGLESDITNNIISWTSGKSVYADDTSKTIKLGAIIESENMMVSDLVGLQDAVEVEVGLIHPAIYNRSGIVFYSDAGEAIEGYYLDYNNIDGYTSVKLEVPENATRIRITKWEDNDEGFSVILKFGDDTKTTYHPISSLVTSDILEYQELLTDNALLTAAAFKKLFTLDKDVNGQYYIKTPYSLASEGAISTKGIGSSGGGTGGAMTLYQLNDVLAAESGDNVYGSENGNVLSFRDGKWQGETITLGDLANMAEGVDEIEDENKLLVKKANQDKWEAVSVSELGEADKTFVYTQGSMSKSWEVNHGLNKFPSVTIVDSLGSTVLGEVIYNDLNNVTINFSATFSGQAFFN